MSRLRWNVGQVIQDNEDIGIEGVDYFKRGAAYYTEEYVIGLLKEINNLEQRVDEQDNLIKELERLASHYKGDDKNEK